MPSYYRAAVSDFLQTRRDSIVATLTEGDRAQGFPQLSHDQIRAWNESIDLLKSSLAVAAAENAAVKRWGILLEYTIPRRDKRIDAVLLPGGAVVVVEFKVGAKGFSGAGRAQVEDYALDLSYYHERSRGRCILPVLCATAATASEGLHAGDGTPGVSPTTLVSGDGLAELLRRLSADHRAAEPGDPAAWDESPYRPVPGIIEAACALYAGHEVVDLRRARAENDVLVKASDRLLEIVSQARRDHRKVICFVTGVPGSGKTLTGLQVVHSPDLRRGADVPGVFLSGNGPLIKVIAEALARDYSMRAGVNLAAARSQARTFIVSVHGYLAECLPRRTPPAEHLVVFDEAQRAWDAEKMLKMAGRQRRGSDRIRDEHETVKGLDAERVSEPARLLRILDRHGDWAAIVALVGTGQEIHDGEAGIEEWFRVLAADFPSWEVHVSPEVQVEEARQPLLISDSQRVSAARFPEPALHLTVPVRTHGSSEMAEWVDAVLTKDLRRARAAAAGFGGFPVRLTRDLDAARDWLWETTLGTRRCGLVASSSAGRLRPYGIEVSAGFRKEVSYPTWFTGPREDLRSSFALEVPATEFECQGLELDRVGVCWGGDLVIDPRTGQWLFRKLTGTEWKREPKGREISYLRNAYRVLLTRAREGLVVWIPKGHRLDPTRDPALWDATATWLLEAGVGLTQFRRQVAYAA